MPEKNIPKNAPREEHAGHHAPKWQRIQEGHAPVKMQPTSPPPPPPKTPGTENLARPQKK